MSATSKLPEDPWLTSNVESVARRRPPRWRESRLPHLAHVLAALAVGILAAHFLTLGSALGVACVLMMAAVALPLLAARLLKDRLRSPAEEPLRCRAAFEYRADEAGPADHIPAALLILSSDLRVCFANRACSDVTLQTPQEMLGWRLEDVLPAEGLEEQAKALLMGSGTATSCSFASFPGRSPLERRPVSITMTRIPPVDGEDRILVLVEDLLDAFPTFQSPVVEGYVC